MKTIYSMAMGLLMVWVSNAQTFKKIDGAATDICTDKQGNVFVVSTIRQVLKFDYGQSKFKIHAVAKGSAEVVAGANKDTYVIARGKTHQTSSRGTNAFYNVSAPTLNDIYVDTKNSLWGINSATRIVNKGPKGWQVFQPAGANNKKLALNNSGRVFALKANNAIYEYYNGRARKLPGAATDIAYDHKQNKLYVLGTSKRFFVWNPGRNNWDLVKNTRNDFKSIAAHDGKLWGTTTRNEIYTTANIGRAIAEENKDVHKLKITLVHLESSAAWDVDGKDDYLLHFVPSLKLKDREQFMKYKKYGRIKKQIETYGPKNALHVRRTKEQTDHATVQIHVPEKSKKKIINSGIFEIPKSFKVTDSGTDFTIKIVVDEVSKETTRLINENARLNLKEILRYLNKKSNTNNYKSRGGNWVDLGSGYEDMSFTAENGKRVVYANFFESVTKNYSRTAMYVFYTLELVD